MTDAPLDDWSGVKTDDAGRVTVVSLYTNGLSGAIPPELGYLASLERLDLGENRLSGSIPPELGDLTRLTTLSLHTNSLSGTIPESFLQLKRLQRLVLRNNSLCVPRTSAFTVWLAGLNYEDTGDFEACSGSGAPAGSRG